MIIKTVVELEKEVMKNKWEFVGMNWIGVLVQLYMKVEKKIIINVSNEKNLVNKNILLLGKEKDTTVMAQRILLKQNDLNIAVISDSVKDYLESFMMKKYPEIYESEILISRKKEMDQQKKDEFNKAINNIDNEAFPIFESIEIETINRCNGTCNFCPINRNDDTRKLHKMEESLFYNVIDQLAEIKYCGRISLFSNNEPFIDKRIYEFSEYTSNKLPGAYKILFTNGSLITEEGFNRIIPHLNMLNFDIYYDNSIKDEIPSEVKKIIRSNMFNDNIKQKVMFQFIDRKAIRNNRGGQSKNRKKIYRVQAPCMLPFIQMIVRPTGETSLCCNDALGKYTLSDLNHEKLVDAWNNEKYNEIRENIRKTRQNIEMCQLCDNFASSNTVGNNIFFEKQIMDAWNTAKKMIS